MAVKSSNTEPLDDTPGMLTPPKGGHVPFDGQGKSVTVVRDVNPPQLIEEVYARLGNREDFEVVAHLDGDTVSEETPMILHVLGDADMRTVLGAVNSHVPDPAFGLDDEGRKIVALKERLRSGEDLSPTELNVLLRTMM